MRRIQRATVNEWLHREPSAEAAARLFCLPYSGCGASMYRSWPRFIGSVEVCPVQLPARENRFREPHYGTYEALAGQLIAALAGYLDRPFAFFGHCGSALPGFEASVQLALRGGPAPANLFVSAQVAPHDGPFGRFLELSDDGLRAELRALMLETGGAPTDDLLDVYLDVLRADLAANKSYRRDPVVLPHPITAIGWSADTEVDHTLMTGWTACGEAQLVVLPGPHYRFLHAPAALLEVIRGGLLPEESAT